MTTKSVGSARRASLPIKRRSNRFSVVTTASKQEAENTKQKKNKKKKRLGNVAEV